MSEPTTSVIDTRPDTAVLREWKEIWDSPAHREALLRTLELLKSLNERGLLDAARATFEGSDAAAHSIEEFLRESQNLRVARNLRALYTLLASLDFERILSPKTSFTGARGGEGSRRPPMGLIELRRRLKDPVVAAGLEIVLEALAQVGRSRKSFA